MTFYVKLSYATYHILSSLVSEINQLNHYWLKTVIYYLWQNKIKSYKPVSPPMYWPGEVSTN